MPQKGKSRLYHIVSVQKKDFDENMGLTDGFMGCIPIRLGKLEWRKGRGINVYSFWMIGTH